MSLPVDNLHIYLLILRPRKKKQARRLKELSWEESSSPRGFSLTLQLEHSLLEDPKTRKM